MGTPSTVREVSLNLNSAQIVLAVVQLKSSFPDGKEEVFFRSRETFAWKSRTEIEARIEKCYQVLEFIHDEHPEANLVIFPEYTLPVDLMIDGLQERATLYNQIIIAGGDSIWQPDGKHIFNQCPVFIPNRSEPIWVTKRKLSQWESGKVDEPKHHQNPAFTWEVNSKKYWIILHICFDFLLAIRESLPSDKDPVLHLTSMCSPDINTFRTYADTILWEEGGRAVILCNSGGDQFAGNSSVFAVAPGGARLKPALDIPHRQEGLLIFELDVDHLVLPKKTTPTTKSPIGKAFAYGINTELGSVAITPISSHGPDEYMTRGVINPALFSYYGKTLRITFLSVEAYGILNEAELIKKAFECYSILGHSDLMVSHLHQSAYAMITDISETIPWKLSPDLTAQKADSSTLLARFPYFEVNSYYKVLGVTISEEDIRAFDGNPVMTDDLRKILLLGKNWNDPTVSEEFKDMCRAKKWILETTNLEPGEIDAVMTIYLDYPAEIQGHFQTFELHVLPKLIQNSAITSIYAGSNQRLPAHFILRVACGIKDLSTLIHEIHGLAASEKLLLTTNTYVIVKKWSGLQLSDSLLSTGLLTADERYRDLQVFPKLPVEAKAICLNLDAETQIDYLSRFRTLTTVIRSLSGKKWLKNDEIHRMESDLAIGLLTEDYNRLSYTHALLQGRTEAILKFIIEKAFPEESDLDKHKGVLGIQSGKDKKGLTYTERVKVVVYCCKEGLVDQSILVYVQQLFDHTITVRNALTHSDFPRLTLNTYTQALVIHCEFINHCDDELIS
ncbi:MAG TPA: hypothetical protein VF708_07090 [Pyrinomonadaceae bacterium]|jgi:hypothetical protein